MAAVNHGTTSIAMREIFKTGRCAGLTRLPQAGSRQLDSQRLDWQGSETPEFHVRPLLEDGEAGIRTWLMKVDAGACAPPHAHAEYEQIYVLEGSFYDQDNTYRAGEYIVRAPGAVHSAGSEDGALVLLFYSPPSA